MLLIIDNYDSFVFNVARYCEELGWPPTVLRNDAIDLDWIEAAQPEAIVISPGPSTPDQAGVSLPAVKRFSGRIPILGVCLGHQCIGAAFGGHVTRAHEPMHGRASLIGHQSTDLFEGLPAPLTVGRYHSLVVEETPQMRQDLRVTARTDIGEIMALEHRNHPTYGVQFHPESVLSDHGHDIFGNFFAIARGGRHAVA